MPRGGRRKGRSGTAYQNRSDLNAAQPVKVTTNQEYGQRAAQEAAQQAMPLPQVSRVGAAPVLPAQAQGPLPGSVTGLDAPTSRPAEPLTAGLPMGPGPGPEVLSQTGPNDPLSMMRVLYRLFPYEEIREQLEIAETEAYDRSLSMPKAQ